MRNFQYLKETANLREIEITNENIFITYVWLNCQ